MKSGASEALGAALMLGLFAWVWQRLRPGGDPQGGGVDLDGLRVNRRDRQAPVWPEVDAPSVNPSMIYPSGAGSGVRGIRNNNPGNIEYTGTEWVGLAPNPSDGRFCIFIAPEYGLRAMYRVLQTYRRRGVRAIAEIVRTWAPPSDGNDTERYIRNVANRTGLRAAQPLETVGDYIAVMQAMVIEENGVNPYSGDQYRLAVEMADDTAVTPRRWAQITGAA